MPHAAEARARTPESLPPFLSQLEHCLRKGCFFCIEHTPQGHVRHGRWTLWDKPSCYDGDLGAISSAIAQCREQNADRLIRLNIEDFSFRSRFTVMVHDPAANEG